MYVLSHCLIAIVANYVAACVDVQDMEVREALGVIKAKVDELRGDLQRQR